MRMYVLRGVDGEYLLVVRTHDEDSLWSALRRLRKDKRLRKYVDEVEERLNDT